MSFSEIKNKNIVLYGIPRFCEAFELLLYELNVIRRVFVEEHANLTEPPEELKELITHPTHPGGLLIIICDFELDNYCKTLYKLGWHYQKDYAFALEILQMFLNEHPYLRQISRSDEDFEKNVNTSLSNFIIAVDERICNKNCNMPENAIFVMPDGIRGCCISPKVLGQVIYVDYNDLITGFDYRLFRMSILNGSYVFCRGCGFLALSDTTPVFSEPLPFEETKGKASALPGELRLGHDPSCNLACKSCRKDRILYHKLPIEKRHWIQATSEIIVKDWLDHFDSVVLAINGDAFASHFYRDIALNRFTGKKITIQTNGLLLRKEKLEALTERYADKKLHLFISIDAASAETYKDIRGGNFNILLENLQRIGEARRQNKISHLHINFIVQKRNFREMIKFVHQGKSISADIIYFQKLMPYTCETTEEYQDQNIYWMEHPEHAELSTLLKDPVFDDDSIMFDIPR